MINIEQFIEAVTSVSQDKNTGRLRVGLRVEGKLQFATLLFIEGQICECEFRGQSGKAAVRDLLEHAIVSSVFIWDKIPADTVNSTTLDVEQLILLARERQIENATPAFDPNELIGITIDTLGKFVGKRAGVLVEDIATRYPPEKSAKDFLQESEKFATEFVGARKAQKIFQPLFALI